MARTVPGEEQPASDAIVPDLDCVLGLLDARAATGDAACALAAQVLRREHTGGFAPDAIEALVDRLVQLVQEQDAQIRALRALVEGQL